MKTPDLVDAVVVGGGPAGAGAAIALARAGASVVLLERAVVAKEVLGESLPPSANAALERLGLAGRMASDGHQASAGHLSAWGSDELAEVDYVCQPFSCGWHIDRSSFEAALLESARAAGVIVRRGVSVQTCATGVRGCVVRARGADNESATFDARWVVDCSGRASVVARAHGAQRRRGDRLCAVVRLLGAAATCQDADDRLLLESSSNGWWYTTRCPGGRAVIFMTDADLPAARQARDREGWRALVRGTTHVRSFVERGDYLVAPSRARAVDASTARLDAMVGPGWIAVGDAAISHDPLSSQGILQALGGGIHAARALIDGRPSALRSYEEQLCAGFTTYRRLLNHYYDQEQRWPESPFWRRRVSNRSAA